MGSDSLFGEHAEEGVQDESSREVGVYTAVVAEGPVG